MTPLGRIGRPKLAAAAGFLASDESSIIIGIAMGSDSASGGYAGDFQAILCCLPTTARWAVLLAASALTAAALQWAKLPAALMLGPLAASVLMQTAGGAVKVPPSFMAVAQAVSAARLS